ncbi:ERAD-associated protein [Physocladia obscura]|uniref:ERAD-associated protein n=1 Tax=Physocladia obscura TaxID=109957 RepID=A0AAD5SZ28_9FUNG|nr:ERAD-associated protein [Physocladia obscura]
MPMAVLGETIPLSSLSAPSSSIPATDASSEAHEDVGQRLFEYGYTGLRLAMALADGGDAGPSKQPAGAPADADDADDADDDDDDDDGKAAGGMVGGMLRLLRRRMREQQSAQTHSGLRSGPGSRAGSATALRARLAQLSASAPPKSSFPFAWISASDFSPASVRTKAVAILDYAFASFANRDATMLLADMHLHSRMLHPRNVTKAIAYYTPLADVGNATAQRVLGLMHATGLGVPRDYAKALLYMSFAALGNDLIAHQTLGYWHSQGIATPKSCEDAVWHYKIVADKVIELFKTGPPGGRTVPMSKVRLPDADGGVFGHGASGSGTPPKSLPQTAEAQRNVRDIYEISAQEGDHSIQLELASIYYSGTRHTPPNHKKALKYFLSAAKAYVGKRPTGEISQSTKHLVSIASMASGYLGTMYWRGEGVKKNEVIARQWFERGEELANPMSLNGLGMMILEGVAGFEIDTRKALQYFTDAIQKDYPDAYVNLAELTLKTGNSDALASALKFYNTAATKPPASPLTLYRLAEFHSKGLGGTPKNCATAFGFYKSLVEKADWHAIDDIGGSSLERAHEHYTRDTTQDLDSAFILYLFAAERGVEVAQTNAAWMIDHGLVGNVGEHKSIPVASNSESASLTDNTDSTVGGELAFHTNDLYEIALILWNRAANQGNVDARVKMGDYHYYGIGLKAFEAFENEQQAGFAEDETEQNNDDYNGDEKSGTDAANTKIISGFAGGLSGAIRKIALPWLSKHEVVVLSKPRYDKAALYYQVAADEASSLAQWNIGWMHENGIGVTKDYPLAKRMYDMSLATNPEAYLAVNLALTNLAVKSFISKSINTVTESISPRAVRAFLKKHHWIEEIDHFPEPENPHEHIKGAIPASVEHGASSLSGSGGSGGSGARKNAFFEGLWTDVAAVGTLSVIIAGLFVMRRLLKVPEPVPVTVDRGVDVNGAGESGAANVAAGAGADNFPADEREAGQR